MLDKTRIYNYITYNFPDIYNIDFEYDRLLDICWLVFHYNSCTCRIPCIDKYLDNLDSTIKELIN